MTDSDSFCWVLNSLVLLAIVVLVSIGWLLKVLTTPSLPAPLEAHEATLHPSWERTLRSGDKEVWVQAYPLPDGTTAYRFREDRLSNISAGWVVLPPPATK